jgi:hypothetical protein
LRKERRIRFVVAVLSAALTVVFVWWLRDVRDGPWWLQLGIAAGAVLGTIRTWEAIRSLRSGRTSPRAMKLTASLVLWTALLALMTPIVQRVMGW